MVKIALVASFLCLATIGLTFVTAASVKNNNRFSINDFITFEVFKKNFNKTYSLKEEIIRKATYALNLKDIIEANNWARDNGYDWESEVNEFADMDFDSFLASYTGAKIDDALDGIKTIKVSSAQKTNAPASLDWRDKNKVGAIKNQGSCGSCWTFSTISVIESAYAIKTNSNYPPVLSEQQLLDCVSKDSGCGGGYPQQAAQYAVSNGVMRSSDYRYVEKKNSKCYFNSKSSLIKPTSYVKWKGTEKDLAAKIAEVGPVATAMYVTRRFKSYKSGIFYDLKCSFVSSVNHAVVIVGYGQQNNRDYWLLRNSWGTKWGMKGYFMLPRGKNFCNMMSQPFYFTF